MRLLPSSAFSNLRSSWSAIACGLLLGGRAVEAIPLDLTDATSIKNAAATIVSGMMTYYTGNQGNTPGNLPGPYYWWEAGAMFGALIDYWYYTGDSTYNNETMQAMMFQAGSTGEFMPLDQTTTEGNDDQAFWGMAAMSAAELNFPNPPADKPQWLAMVQAVVNLQISRWDTTTCNGGLKWQIFTFNSGYNYKNTIANIGFFNMCARLYKYTGNSTYLEWAEKSYDWTARVGLMSPTYQFFDGTDDLQNCTSVNHIQWTYNAGAALLGAATLWNATQNQTWYERTSNILNATDVFFSPQVPNVMFEVACEPSNTCDLDQKSFKAYLSRWMAATTKVAPWTYDFVMPKLQASAVAAAAQCSGGSTGQVCGLEWTKGSAYDGKSGVGEQMSALEVIQSNLITKVAGPVTNSTGGTSIGNPSAGTGGDRSPVGPTWTVTGGDRAGAGILTTLVLVGIVGGAWWMIA